MRLLASQEVIRHVDCSYSSSWRPSEESRISLLISSHSSSSSRCTISFETAGMRLTSSIRASCSTRRVGSRRIWPKALSAMCLGSSSSSRATRRHHLRKLGRGWAMVLIDGISANARLAPRRTWASAARMRPPLFSEASLHFSANVDDAVLDPGRRSSVPDGRRAHSAPRTTLPFAAWTTPAFGPGRRAPVPDDARQCRTTRFFESWTTSASAGRRSSLSPGRRAHFAPRTTLHLIPTPTSTIPPCLRLSLKPSTLVCSSAMARWARRCTRAGCLLTGVSTS